MEKNNMTFCPNCGIGLNTRELDLGFCQNCKASWDVRIQIDKVVYPEREVSFKINKKKKNDKH